MPNQKHNRKGNFTFLEDTRNYTMFAQTPPKEAIEKFVKNIYEVEKYYWEKQNQKIEQTVSYIRKILGFCTKDFADNREEDTLLKKIPKLVEKWQLSAEMEANLHTIRKWTNNMSHDTENEEVNMSLEFFLTTIFQVLKRVFQENFLQELELDLTIYDKSNNKLIAYKVYSLTDQEILAQIQKKLTQMPVLELNSEFNFKNNKEQTIGKIISQLREHKFSSQEIACLKITPKPTIQLLNINNIRVQLTSNKEIAQTTIKIKYILDKYTKLKIINAEMEKQFPELLISENDHLDYREQIQTNYLQKLKLNQQKTEILNEIISENGYHIDSNNQLVFAIYNRYNSYAEKTISSKCQIKYIKNWKKKIKIVWHSNLKIKEINGYLNSIIKTNYFNNENVCHFQINKGQDLELKQGDNSIDLLFHKENIKIVDKIVINLVISINQVVDQKLAEYIEPIVKKLKWNKPLTAEEFNALVKWKQAKI